MANKHKNNNIWYIAGGIVIVVLIAVIFIVNSNKNSVPVCHAPNILIGTSCCLDSNTNNICDKDEVEPEKKIWTLSDFRVYGTTWFNLPIKSNGYSIDFDTDIPEYPSNPIDIELGLKQVFSTSPEKAWTTCNNYYGALLVVTTDAPNNYYDREKVSCTSEEYYDGALNEKLTNTFATTGASGEKNNYGYNLNLGFEKDKKPSEAKYIITCVGETSKKSVSKTFRFNIRYLDEISVKYTFCM